MAHKPTFNCPFCMSVYDSRRELQEHISDEHLVERPVILFKGKEPAAHSIIRSAVKKSDIDLANATSVRLGKNGGTPTPASVEDVAGAISSTRNAELKILLSNEIEPNASPVENFYNLSMRVADTKSLRDVEHAFNAHLVAQSISRELIGAFLSDTRCTGTGKEYATGLAEYTLGILLKERPDTEMLTTPFSRYREEYGSALARLSDFDRRLAVLVCDVIRFALNDFDQSTHRSGFLELDSANSSLNDPDSMLSVKDIEEETKRRPICPIDHGTARILDLATRMAKQSRWSPILGDECRTVANSETISGADKDKAFAIWGATAFSHKAFESATEPLRNISAVYPFSKWAEKYLEQVET